MNRRTFLTNTLERAALASVCHVPVPAAAPATGLWHAKWINRASGGYISVTTPDLAQINWWHHRLNSDPRQKFSANAGCLTVTGGNVSGSQWFTLRKNPSCANCAPYRLVSLTFEERKKL